MFCRLLYYLRDDLNFSVFIFAVFVLCCFWFVSVVHRCWYHRLYISVHCFVILWRVWYRLGLDICLCF